MSVTPDIDGYKEATRRLRQRLGSTVTFRIPVAKTYGPDVAIDPESNEPYDPTQVPASGGGFTTHTLVCGVIFRPVRKSSVQDEVSSSPIGVERTDTVAVTVDAADWPTVDDATEFVLNTIVYNVTDSPPEGLVTIDRYIVFGQPK